MAKGIIIRNTFFLLVSLLVAFKIDVFALSNSKNELKEYDIHKIPIELLKDADVIIRKDIEQFTVEDENSAVYKVKYAVTLFKPTEKKYGRLILDYDKFRKVEDLDGTIYDANGDEIRTLNDRDIDDYSSVAGYSLYEDDRVKVAELFYDRFPYTIEL